MKCKHCDSEQTVKAGKNGSGGQRYRCKGCGRHFTPNPNAVGYPLAIRQEAVAMDVDGHGYRQTGRNVRVNHQSVANWVKAAAQQALAAPIPRPPVDDNTVTYIGGGDQCRPPALSGPTHPEVTLFVRCWNRRQLYKRAYPLYNPPLRDFASIWV